MSVNVPVQQTVEVPTMEEFNELKDTVEGIEIPAPQPAPQPVNLAPIMNALEDLDGRVSTLENAPAPTVPAQPANPEGSERCTLTSAGLVEIDAFPGADDAAKLRAAMSYAAAQTQKPALVVRHGAFIDAKNTPFEMYDGFKMIGMAGGETEFSHNTRVNVRGTNGVFAVKPSGRTRGVLFKDIGFEGSVSTTFIKDAPFNTASGYLAYSQFDGVSIDLFKHVYWGPMLGCQWFGTTYINNVQETALHVGGSDNALFMDGLFLDQNAGTTRAQRLAQMGMLRFGSFSKSTIGPVYITGDPGLPILITGESIGLVFQGARLEGRNADKPSSGAVVRVEGGAVTFSDVWASYAMANPAENGRNEGGVINVSGGSVLVNGAFYKRATGVSEDVPFVNVTGGRAIVRNVQGIGMSKLPLVRKSGSGQIIADDTVRLG